jgi:hypothetical protein
VGAGGVSHVFPRDERRVRDGHGRQDGKEGVETGGLAPEGSVSRSPTPGAANGVPANVDEVVARQAAEAALGGREIEVSCSVGVSEGERHGGDIGRPTTGEGRERR